MSKEFFKSRFAKHDLRVAISICVLVGMTASTQAFAQQTSSQSEELKTAVRLFNYNREYAGALSILEKLAITTPNDGTVMYGLGVCLLLNAVQHLQNTSLKEQAFKRAREALLRAKSLGIDDRRLEGLIMVLTADAGADRTRAIEFEVSMIRSSPPEIFETDPPRGIKLLEGYRHKSSVDFEGQTTGVIYRPNGLRIIYVIGGYEGEYVKAKEKEKYRWYREPVANGLVFRCAIATDMLVAYKGELFVISTTLSEKSDSGLVSTANFWAIAKTREDVADMLLMVLGLTQ